MSSDPGRITCAVCGTSIDACTGGVSCRACESRHHRACWEYVGHCSTYACGEKRFLVCEPEDLVPRPLALAGPAASPPGVPVASPPAVPETPRVSPWSGGTVYCPSCRGVNPWPCRVCAFCEAPLGKLADGDSSWLPAPSVPPVPLVVRLVAVADGALALGACLVMFSLPTLMACGYVYESPNWREIAFLMLLWTALASLPAVLAFRFTRRLLEGAPWAVWFHRLGWASLVAFGWFFVPALLLAALHAPSARAYLQACSASRALT